MRSNIAKQRSPFVKLYLLPAIGKFLIALVFFLGMVAGGTVFFHNQSLQAQAQINKTKSRVESEITQNAYRYGELSFLSQNTQFAKAQYDAILKEFPPSSKMGDLLSDITKLGTREGLRFVYFKPQAEAMHDYYASVPVNIAVVGGFHQIGKFLSALANLPSSVVVVNQFQMSHAQEQLGLLSLTFTVTLYYVLPQASDIKV